ncbi:MAG: GNAT family N-acetyltransferase [Anaerolineales bacterium]|nr:GNAT family N-acetyltransferase [Anaerolineales bacterium]
MQTDNLEIVALSEDNIETEHICCGFSDKKCAEGYQLKKEWLRHRFGEGFVFKKFDVRGKVFIEYVPAEYAWRPIQAPGYMCIQCFWVSGRYKGQGLGRRLLQECIADSQGKNGIAVVTSKRKKPYLTDKNFFVKHGFEVCDTAPPYFELLVKRFREAPTPRFRENARNGTCEHERGLVFTYTNQCPFTEFYVNEMAEVANTHGIPGQKIRMTTREEVQNGPSPFGVFGVFYEGEFLSHKVMSRNKFDKLLSKVVA